MVEAASTPMRNPFEDVYDARSRNERPAATEQAAAALIGMSTIRSYVNP